MYRSPIHCISLALILAAASWNVSAEMYKCVDPQTGNITLTDVACIDKELGTAIKAPEDYANRPRQPKSYQFPSSAEKFLAVEGSSRCDTTRQKIASILAEINGLEEKSKSQDIFDRLDTKHKIEELHEDAYLLFIECP
jgi:hypothetical protein